MSHVVRAVPRVRVIDGITLQITELIWSNEGYSFEVHRLDTGEHLTADGCFDLPPTTGELAELLDDALNVWRCVCGHRVDAAATALVDGDNGMGQRGGQLHLGPPAIVEAHDVVGVDEVHRHEPGLISSHRGCAIAKPADRLAGDYGVDS